MLIERAAQLAQAEMEQQREPDREVVLQNGQKVSLYTLVEMRKTSVREAKQYVQVLQDLSELAPKIHATAMDRGFGNIPNLLMVREKPVILTDGE